jgi:signal transduction histidine kinase
VRTIGDIHELRDGIRWLIRLRWVAVVGVVVTIFAANKFLHLDICVPGLYGAALFLLLYNIAFALLFQRYSGILSSRIIANLQIFLDFLSLTILLHFSGGIDNPFIFYHVFHTIVSAILLTRIEAVVLTFLAVAMFSAMVLTEHFGVVAHWRPYGPGTPSLHDAPLYLFGQSFVLVSMLLLSLYMTISVSERSRRKNVEISSIRERLTRQEMVRSEGEALREEKLASLGQMSAGIAHEINNPLTIILANVEFAIEDLEEEHPARESLDIVQEEVIRCRGIIEQLLTFSRGDQVGRKICDAGEVLNDSVSLIQNYATLQHVKIDSDIPEEHVYCSIHEGQIKQVLVNVIMNGIQAMPEGGRIGVEVSQKTGEYVQFAIQDSGHGIPKSVLKKIFDPFFTTKQVGKGTGLGLSVCHRLVENHNGVMNVESGENEGTRIEVRLPCVH